ncbi:MAG TPA: adenylate/guanylate cyclase domain-containing protein [bacterium]|nr:adenylate/guanylate cyclase domain-containing protein [bacterium]
MGDLQQPQLEQVRHAIAVMEAQRDTLGDAVVEAALAALRQQLAALEAEEFAAPAPVEERRLITILFTDIVGSTAHAQGQDPEEWRHIVASLHATVGMIVQAHHGTVAQYLGDGLLAFFGAESSSEHDPENAIRAALEAQSAVAGLNGTRPIQIRAGIHTGLVVVGELGSEAKREFTATGDAMNVAARLQSAAPPGGIVITHDTYQYVRGVFTLTPQPPLMIKGKSDPVQTYLVRRVKPRPFRAVTRGVAGIQTRTVGRTAEFHRLQAAYLDAFEHRRVVWAQLVGEAGIGKSRLMDDVRDWIDLRPEVVRVFRARAYAGDGRQPFSLIRRMWFDRFQIAEDAPLAQAEAKWVQRFQELGKTDEVEPAHALGLLVGLPFTDSPHIGAMRGDPAQVKGRAFVASREFLRRIRQEQPIEVLLEDLQWADASSWEYLLQVVLEETQPDDGYQGTFVLAAARPEWSPPDELSQDARYLPIDLQPLSDEATRELVSEMLQPVEGVPEDVVRLIVERSEGVPYFAEEMVNWFLDRGIIDRSREPWRFVSARLKETPLPATLQHLLLTRLSALNDAERAVLQRGAIFGRNFWGGGLEALGMRHPDTLLGPLQPRGFVEAQPESSFEGETEWSFHHTLLRDVTYESVLKRQRAALHKAAADWLEEQARRAGRLDEFAGLLGEHAERAGEMTAAADWYLQAGERAKARGATAEARKFLDRALELLPPIDRERRWRVLVGREEVLGILGEPDAWRADVTGLLELAKELDDDNRLAEVYHRQADYARKTADYRAGLRAAAEAVAVARRAHNPLIEAQALSLSALAQGRLGELDAASRTAEEALARAHDLGDDATLALTLSRVAGVVTEAGDLARGQHFHQREVEIFRRLGNRAQEASALANLGYGYVLLGLYKLGRSALEQSLELAEAIGARRNRAYILQNLGLAHFRSGDGRTARRILDQSLIDMVAVDDAWGRAATLYYLGLVMELSGDMAGAARRFQEAKGIFADLGARGPVVDTWSGLARCALAQAHLDDARQHATDIWKFLTEHGGGGMEAPVWGYQTCADIFDALGEPEQARAAVEAGYREMIDRAEKISDPDWRQSFLENVTEHRAITEMWEALSRQPQP